MELTLSQDSDRAAIAISGDIDEEGAETLKSRFGTLNTGTLEEVVFDFAGVTHIGSAGLGKLLLFYKAMASHGGTIRITHAAGPIYEMLVQLKLDTIFPINR